MTVPDLKDPKPRRESAAKRVIKPLGLALGALATAFGIVQFLVGTPTLNDFMIATHLRDVQRFGEKQVARVTHAPVCDEVCTDFWLRDESGRYVRVVDPGATFSIVTAGSTNSECRGVAEILATLEDAFDPYIDVSTYYIALDSRIDTVENARRFKETYGLSTHVLTGTPREIGEAARRIRAYYQTVSTKEKPYGLNHSLTIYVFDREGRFLMPLSSDLPASRMVDLIISKIQADADRKIDEQSERAASPLSAALFGVAHAADFQVGDAEALAANAPSIAAAADNRQLHRRIPPCASIN